MQTATRATMIVIAFALSVPCLACSGNATPAGDTGPDAPLDTMVDRDLPEPGDRGVESQHVPDGPVGGDGIPPGTVGAPCTGPSGSGTVFIPVTNDCQTSGCLYYSAGVGDPQPLCTKICASDADCPSGTSTCPGGFGCGVLVLTTSIACCKMCICKDYLPNGMPPNPSYCRGIKPTCPL
jgi:hypothetical protein